jgi:hypothetical protein
MLNFTVKVMTDNVLMTYLIVNFSYSRVTGGRYTFVQLQTSDADDRQTSVTTILFSFYCASHVWNYLYWLRNCSVPAHQTAQLGVVSKVMNE